MLHGLAKTFFGFLPLRLSFVVMYLLTGSKIHAIIHRRK